MISLGVETKVKADLGNAIGCGRVNSHFISIS